jgi:hypothetical protein
MFGYELCSTCNLYHLTQDLNENICVVCSHIDPERNPPIPLSKPQYKKLYEKRLKAVKVMIKPTLPAYPSDVFDRTSTYKPE